jgi:hypothetical protein
MPDLDKKIKVGILDPKKNNTSVLKSLFENQIEIEKVFTYDNANSLVSDFENEKLDALILNLYSFGISESLDLISFIRKEYNSAPICLIGNRNELSFFKGVPDNWKKRFEHYYKLVIDETIEILTDEVSQMSKMLLSYWIARTAKIRLRYLRDVFSTPDKSDNQYNKAEIQDIFDLAEKAIDRKMNDRNNLAIIPGIDEKDLQKLVNDTLDKSSKSISNYANLNKLIIYFGLGLLTVSFIVVLITKDYELLGFGGFGLAGIIASLITNPIKSIGKGARQIVQIQTSYFGFLNQIKFLNSIDPKDFKESIDKSKRLQEVTVSIHESLEKYF